MTTTKTLRVLSILHKHGAPVNLLQLFSDTTTSVTDTQIIRERKQVIGGQTFVVCSIFDRGAPRSAADKLHTLVERDAEKDCCSAL